jgi:hypothetical protein
MAVKHKITASASIKTGYTKLVGFLLATNGSDDPIVTVFDDASNTAGTEVVPTNTYDASALGLNGAWFGHEGAIECQVGVYVEVTNLGVGGYVLVYVN